MKKLYSPKGTVKEGLYTDGEKFMTRSYENYVGFYNVQSDGNVYTGYKYDEKSKMLIKYNQFLDNNKVVLLYDKVKEHDLPDKLQIVYKEFTPSKEDYMRGVAFRYFCKKIKSDYIVEINEKQYNKLASESYSTSLIYNYIRIPWKLTGEMFDSYSGNIRIVNGVHDTNKRIVKNANKKLFGLSNYINSHIEKTIFSDYYKKLINDNK